MTIRFFFLLAFSLAFVLPAHAQGIIKAIHVEGQERVEKATVLSYLDIREGQNVSKVDLDRGLKTLFATGLFADVVLQQRGNNLHIKVTENPLINRIIFEGNDQLSDDELRPEVSLRPRQVFTRAKVQADVERLYQLYRRNGRFATIVKPSAVKLDQNRVDLIFEIDESAVTKVEAIRFIGNKKYTDDKLREEISTKESVWYSFISNNDRYDPDRLSYDQQRLRQFYLSQGYADFQVTSAVAELSNSRDGFFITITVDEGERYKINDIQINSAIRAIDTDALMADVKLEVGDWYDAGLVQSSINAMTNTLGNQQYAFVNIRPDVQRNRVDATLDITLKIDESPRVFVERINITGNVRTLDKVIRRAMLLVEGDPFNKSKLAKSEQRIRNLDFFETVNLNTRPGSAPDQSIIDIAVTEKSTGEFRLVWFLDQ